MASHVSLGGIEEYQFAWHLTFPISLELALVALKSISLRGISRFPYYRWNWLWWHLTFGSAAGISGL